MAPKLHLAAKRRGSAALAIDKDGSYTYVQLRGRRGPSLCDSLKPKALVSPAIERYRYVCMRIADAGLARRPRSSTRYHRAIDTFKETITGCGRHLSSGRGHGNGPSASPGAMLPESGRFIASLWIIAAASGETVQHKPCVFTVVAGCTPHELLQRRQQACI